MRSIASLVPALLLWLAFTPPANAWELNLQCVPFARAVSGIRLFGDAWRWWSAASGRYARGQRPLPGSVLAFRPSLQMPLGHVAVVTRVTGPRRIEIDHANWTAPGAITTGVTAIDVSERNDWSAVRVELGRSIRFGSVYATEGFIYAKGRPGPGGEEPDLRYVGRALVAARAGAPLTTAINLSLPSTQSALLPWNPVPLAPALPTFSRKLDQIFPSLTGGSAPASRAHPRAF